MSALLEGYAPEDEYCRVRGISQRQAQRERQSGSGPPFVKVGREVYYNISSFRAWLADREIRPAKREAA
jgi:hypothetical protein